jgi:hypothetical protein
MATYDAFALATAVAASRPSSSSPSSVRWQCRVRTPLTIAMGVASVVVPDRTPCPCGAGHVEPYGRRAVARTEQGAGSARRAREHRLLGAGAPGGRARSRLRLPPPSAHRCPPSCPSPHSGPGRGRGAHSRRSDAAEHGHSRDGRRLPDAASTKRAGRASRWRRGSWPRSTRHRPRSARSGRPPSDIWPRPATARCSPLPGSATW